jgi:hypothetical protein
MMHHVSSASDKARKVERIFTIAARIYFAAAALSALSVALFIGSFWFEWLIIPGSLCIIAHLTLGHVAGRWERRGKAELTELQADLRRIHERAR